MFFFATRKLQTLLRIRWEHNYKVLRKLIASNSLNVA